MMVLNRLAMRVLTIGARSSLVKDMKLSQKAVERLVQSIFKELKADKAVIFKEKEETVIARASEVIRQDLAREHALDQEVNKMMDDLERKNPGEFQRFKMFPMLKKRLAKEKGIIL